MLRRVTTQGVILGLLLVGAVAAGPAGAAEPSGSAVKVDPAVNATGPGGKRLLELDGAIFVGDEIVASPIGLAQIKFIDDTRIVVGPNSRLRIDTFVFNPNNTAKKVTISALYGTFRFITGKSAHEAYSIRTPTMTIGVRGSIIDIDVRSVLGAAATVQEGGAEFCGSGGCKIVTDRCQIYAALPGGPVTELAGLQKNIRVANFAFFSDDSMLEDPFRVHLPSCDLAYLSPLRDGPESGGQKSVHTRTPPSGEPGGGPSPRNDNCDYHGGYGGGDDG
jgi:FecR protein